MAPIKLRHRARLRAKDLERFAEAIRSDLGTTPFDVTSTVDRAEATDRFDVLLVDGKPLAMLLKAPGGERPFPTVKGLLAARPERRHVTVDMGAVKFVVNGADVMAPGIVEADPGIRPGDLVWVRDERNKQPLAVGEALLAGASMPRGPKGKAVKSLHYLGDELWNVEV
ncbi:MAG TPA: RNA-binding protein [Candidatus Thermoplasmatota archaeon]|nr:RNA-binding protein [Candidatus Thermoplasmatota archaeon]